jgi:hypothetical protein
VVTCSGGVLVPVINPHGLFEGQRLAACTDRAQLYWPRLYCAANGYARLELHYPTIAARCFHGFAEVPTEQQVLDVVEEYVRHFLAIPYKADGQLWLQFVTEDKYLRRHKTADDEQSPEPPPDSREAFAAGYSAWKEARQSSSKDEDGRFSEKFPNYFRKVAAEFPHGIGIGEGGGGGTGSGDGDGVGDGVGSGVGVLASSKTTKRAAILLDALQLDETPSLLEILETAFAEAAAMYPDKTEKRICQHLVSQRRNYEKLAAAEGMRAVTPEIFFDARLWKESEHWRKFLTPVAERNRRDG